MDFIDKQELKAKREAKLTQKVLEKIERFNLREEKRRIRELSTRNKKIEPEEIIRLRDLAKVQSSKEAKKTFVVYRLSSDSYLIVNEGTLVPEDVVCAQYNENGRKIK